MIGNKEPSTALVRMLLDLWIGLHVHLAACSDPTKAVHPLLLALVLPTLYLFPQPQHTQEVLCQQERQAQEGEGHMLVSLVSYIQSGSSFLKKELSWV